MKEEYLHYYSTLIATDTALEFCDLLPKTDLVCELETILHIQLEIFICIIQDKHFGTDNLIEFMEHIEHIKKQTKRLRNAIKKR